MIEHALAEVQPREVGEAAVVDLLGLGRGAERERVAVAREQARQAHEPPGVPAPHARNPRDVAQRAQLDVVQAVAPRDTR